MNKQYIWVVTNEWPDASFVYLFSTYEKAANWVHSQICEFIKDENFSDRFSDDDRAFYLNKDNLIETLRDWYNVAEHTYDIQSVLVNEFE